MKYRILDQNGDYSFGKGQQDLTYGVYAVKQAIQTRLGLLKKEWWENIDDGLPLFQDILGSPGASNNLVIVDNIIKERIIKTQNVVSISNFKSDYEQRKYTFSCSVLSKFGEINFDMDF